MSYNIIEINKETTKSKVIEQKDNLEDAEDRADELNKETQEIAEKMGLTEHPFSYDVVPDKSILTSTPLEQD